MISHHLRINSNTHTSLENTGWRMSYNFELPSWDPSSHIRWPTEDVIKICLNINAACRYSTNLMIHYTHWQHVTTYYNKIFIQMMIDVFKSVKMQKNFMTFRHLLQYSVEGYHFLSQMFKWMQVFLRIFRMIKSQLRPFKCSSLSLTHTGYHGNG